MHAATSFFLQWIKRNVELNALIHFSSIVKIICWLLLLPFLIHSLFN